MPKIQLTKSEWTVLERLLSFHLPGVTVWAYGSRVKMAAKRTSDLDLVVFTDSPQSAMVSQLKEEFEESSLPFPVDLHVWDQVPERFQIEIQQTYVEIKSGARCLDV